MGVKESGGERQSNTNKTFMGIFKSLQVKKELGIYITAEEKRFIAKAEEQEKLTKKQWHLHQKTTKK